MKGKQQYFKKVKGKQQCSLRLERGDCLRLIVSPNRTLRPKPSFTSLTTISLSTFCPFFSGQKYKTLFGQKYKTLFGQKYKTLFDQKYKTLFGQKYKTLFSQKYKTLFDQKYKTLFGQKLRWR